MIKAIAFSAYPVRDLARAREFYEGTLGLKPSAATFGQHWHEYDLGESTFAIVLATEDAPDFYTGRGAAVAFEVEDLDEAHRRMADSGVPVIYGPAEFPHCRMFVITDPDNNVITLHQLGKAS